ncbi:MAG: SDR family oxidoreductase [Candidatus Schmidhempelia sp.]|nr:SDR family oxidoreductase [Candidatus Schmidhempelia sp.]
MATSLLIFGASRGTGAALTKQALMQGYHCYAVVRNLVAAAKLTSLGVTTFIGDANDPVIVERACQAAGIECTIVSTLGGEKANYQAQINIINQAEKIGIKRMVLITSLGCGDSWTTLSDRAKQAFGLAVREKTLAEVWLQTSSLDYSILRPGGLLDGEPTHNGEYYQGKEIHGYIRRQDLALLILNQVKQRILNRQIYAVVDPLLVVKR